MICTWNDATSARKKEAHVMVEQVIKQELNEEDEALRAKVCACITQMQSYALKLAGDDDDGLDDPAEYEAWKVCEVFILSVCVFNTARCVN